MRIGVLRSLVPVMLAAASIAVGGGPVSAGPPIDLKTLPIRYDYGPPLDGRGFWASGSLGGEWRVTGSRLGPDRRLTLDLEIRPAAISVPLEPGPAVLFAGLQLYGGLGGDVGTYAAVPGFVTAVLPACEDPADCVYRGSVTLETDRLPRLARIHRAEGWGWADISLTLVRTFAQGTWLQVLPLYDETRDEPDGTVGEPAPVTSRMLKLGAFPVAQARPWNRFDRPVLREIEMLRRTMRDPSHEPETVPLLVDLRAGACSYGWTIATATGDTLVNVLRPREPRPIVVDVPVGADWLVSVPSLDRAQGTGDGAPQVGPHQIDGPTRVTGYVSGDTYACPGALSANVTWTAVSDRAVDAFPAVARCIRGPGIAPAWRPTSTSRCMS
jgi:hypothetical protein